MMSKNGRFYKLYLKSWIKRNKKTLAQNYCMTCSDKNRQMTGKIDARDKRKEE